MVVVKEVNRLLEVSEVDSTVPGNTFQPHHSGREAEKLEQEVIEEAKHIFLGHHLSPETHYGSDFDSGSGGESEPEMVEDEELDVESDDDLMPDISEAETDIIDEDGSDSLSINSGLVAKNKQVFAPTPLPYWLQSDQELPTLNLPESSDDLLLPLHQVLPACAVYEVLRKFSSEVK